MIEAGVEWVGQDDETEWLGVYAFLVLPRVGETIFVTISEQQRFEARVLRIVHVSERAAKSRSRRSMTQNHLPPTISLYVETIQLA